MTCTHCNIQYLILYQVMKWQTGGLPRDTHSTENATFVKKARKWPLLIDPQEQAVK